MGDVVNLNRYRKQRERSERQKDAAENRVRFGRDAAEKRRLDSERSRESRRHEGNRLESAGEDEPKSGA
jgi:hypothetical protein